MRLDGRGREPEREQSRDRRILRARVEARWVSHLCCRCYTWIVPTTNRRYAITETDDIANALDLAAKAWPELADKPGALLRRLILLGRSTLAHDRATADDAREQAIKATAGALAGVFGPEYLHELREDWPA